jgi:hypothetical protein
MNPKFSYSKFAGLISVVAVLAVSVAPDTFRVPSPLRPWVFIFAVMWTVLIASGVFL